MTIRMVIRERNWMASRAISPARCRCTGAPARPAPGAAPLSSWSASWAARAISARAASANVSWSTPPDEKEDGDRAAAHESPLRPAWPGSPGPAARVDQPLSEGLCCTRSRSRRPSPGSTRVTFARASAKARAVAARTSGMPPLVGTRCARGAVDCYDECSTRDGAVSTVPDQRRTT